jgi:hypothetical protein
MNVVDEGVAAWWEKWPPGTKFDQKQSHGLV